MPQRSPSNNFLLGFLPFHALLHLKHSRRATCALFAIREFCDTRFLERYVALWRAAHSSMVCYLLLIYEAETLSLSFICNRADVDDCRLRFLCPFFNALRAHYACMAGRWLSWFFSLRSGFVIGEATWKLQVLVCGSSICGGIGNYGRRKYCEKIAKNVISKINSNKKYNFRWRIIFEIFGQLIKVTDEIWRFKGDRNDR